MRLPGADSGDIYSAVDRLPVNDISEPRRLTARGVRSFGAHDSRRRSPEAIEEVHNGGRCDRGPFPKVDDFELAAGDELIEFRSADRQDGQRLVDRVRRLEKAELAGVERLAASDVALKHDGSPPVFAMGHREPFGLVLEEGNSGN